MTPAFVSITPPPFLNQSYHYLLIHALSLASGTLKVFPFLPPYGDSHIDVAAHLGPRRGVPLKARPLEAGAFIRGAFVSLTFIIRVGLELSPSDSHTENDPALLTTAACGVALRETILNYNKLQYPWKTNSSLQQKSKV